MKLALIIVGAVSFGIGAVHAEDAPALLQKYKCYICHADNEAKAGPAYVDVAAVYRGNPKAPAILVALIKKGAHGAGDWPERNPIIAIDGCCARAASVTAMKLPATQPMNVRRSMVDDRKLKHSTLPSGTNARLRTASSGPN
jgi:cytochrome c551/c552